MKKERKWLGSVFMHHFTPGDYMVFEKIGPNEVRITRRVWEPGRLLDCEPSTPSDS